MKLATQAFIKFFSGFILLALLLFLPAGTFFYIRAWLFIGVLFIPMFIFGVYMLFKDPALLKKRLSADEKEPVQKKIIIFSSLMFVFGFIACGLDYRFGVSKMPLWVSLFFSLIMLISYAGFAAVMKENAFLSRTVEIQENQKVIDTGLYAIVRHPMYTATITLFMSMPLVLGSFLGFAVFLSYPTVIVSRIKNEEELLSRELDGYEEYKKRVKWRIIPFIW